MSSGEAIGLETLVWVLASVLGAVAISFWWGLRERRLHRGLEASRTMHRLAVEARVVAEEQLAAIEHDRTDWKDRATIAESQVNRLASRLEHSEAYGARQHEHMLSEKERLEVARLRIVGLTKERDEARAELARWRPGRLPDGRFVKVMEAAQ